MCRIVPALALFGSGCSPSLCPETRTALDLDTPSALGFSGEEVLELADGLVIGVAWPDGTFSEWALTAVPATTVGLEEKATELLRGGPARCPDDVLLVPSEASFSGPNWLVGEETVFEAGELALAGVELHWSRYTLPVYDAPAALEQALRATDDGCPDEGGEPAIHFGDSSLAGGTLTYLLEAPGCFASLSGSFKVLHQ